MIWPWAKPALNPTAIRYDMHNHLLPGVDDGVRNEQQAFEAIIALREMGYRGAVLTPHIFPDAYDNDEPSLHAAFETFHAHAARVFDDFALAIGAEYLLDEHLMSRLAHHPGELLTFGQAQPLLLVELPITYEPPELGDLAATCRTQGIRPVLAHVERYRYLDPARSDTKLTRFKREGAMFQINIGALVGQFGPGSRRRARALWRTGMVDLLGSDLHHPSQALSHIPQGWRYLARRGAAFNAANHLELFEADATQAGD